MIWGPRNTEKGFLFLAAALAALGLPWSLTHSLIVLDSKHSSLPDQTPSSEVDKVADMVVNVPDEDFSDTYLTNGDIYGDEL